METTICPWCQTEIVWDEEIGPEEYCPYCNNELKGYRTLNIGIDEIEDEENEYDGDEDQDQKVFWEHEESGHLDAIRRVETFAKAGGDLLAYDSGVEKVLDGQEEVPECPHCREYMLFAGSQPLPDSFVPAVPAGLARPLVQKAAKLDIYICSACFHVSHFLTEDERMHLIRTVTEEE